MGIIETHVTVNHRYLMGKTKSDLADMYMRLLDLSERHERHAAELHAEGTRAHEALTAAGIQEEGGDKAGNEFALKLDERIKLLVDRAPSVVTQDLTTEATNPHRHARALQALVQHGDVSQERIDIALSAIDSAWALAGEMVDSPAFDRTRAALVAEPATDKQSLTVGAVDAEESDDLSPDELVHMMQLRLNELGRGTAADIERAARCMHVCAMMAQESLRPWGHFGQAHHERMRDAAKDVVRCFLSDVDGPTSGEIVRQAQDVGGLEAVMTKGGLAVLVEDVFGAFRRHGVIDDFDRPSDAIDALIEKARREGAAAAQAEADSNQRMLVAAVADLAAISQALGVPEEKALTYNGPEDLLKRISALRDHPDHYRAICVAFEHYGAGSRVGREALDWLLEKARSEGQSGRGETRVDPDEVIALAQALEQRRALKIVDEVDGLAAGYESTFAAGFEQACEEIAHRLRTEAWDACLPPVGAAAATASDGSAVEELQPETRNLVLRVAAALAVKLLAAQRKGRCGWERNDWLDECRAQLLEHIAKGDPLDVIALASFLWHHGETTRPGHDAEIQTQRARFAIDGALALGAQNESPPPDGHWLTRYWELARSVERLEFERDDAVTRLRDLQGQNNWGAATTPHGWLIPGTRHYLSDDDKQNAIQSGTAAQRAQAEAFSFAVYAMLPDDASAPSPLPLPTPEQARQSWGVAVYADGVDLLVLGHDGSYRGLTDIDSYAHVMRLAATHLNAFIGPEPAPGFYICDMRETARGYARRERDAAIEALRELLASRTARGLDDKASAREARAWARATAALKAHAYRRGDKPEARTRGSNALPPGSRPTAPPPPPSAPAQRVVLETPPASRDRHVR